MSLSAVLLSASLASCITTCKKNVFLNLGVDGYFSLLMVNYVLFFMAQENRLELHYTRSKAT